jgi:hypothetical protein
VSHPAGPPPAPAMIVHVLIAFFVLQEQFVSGLALRSTKG